MAPNSDFDPDGLFNRNVFVKVALVRLFTNLVTFCGFFYCATRKMGEKPSPLGDDPNLIVDAALRIQGVKAYGFKPRLGWSYHLTLRTLGTLGPKPYTSAQGR
jgi:hypothetical protein